MPFQLSSIATNPASRSPAVARKSAVRPDAALAQPAGSKP
jgi:hypothetical protein